jgi:hypothetical protein
MIDGIPLSDLTAPGLLLIAVLMVFVGWLIPKPMYREKKIEAEKWQKAYEIEREARSVSDAQTRELLENSKTTIKVLSALAATFGAPEYEQQSGGAHAASVAK